MRGVRREWWGLSRPVGCVMDENLERDALRGGLSRGMQNVVELNG